jgi:hypothetical protein
VQGAPERQVPAWAQQPVRLAIANLRIDPVPRSRRVDKVEGLRLVLPALERSYVDLSGEACQVSSRDFSELASQFEADDREATFEQGASRFAGRAADFEQASPRFERCKSDQVLKELLGIIRSSAVIEVGGGVKGATKGLASVIDAPGPESASLRLRHGGSVSRRFVTSSRPRESQASRVQFSSCLMGSRYGPAR